MPKVLYADSIRPLSLEGEPEEYVAKYTENWASYYGYGSTMEAALKDLSDVVSGSLNRPVIFKA